MAVLTCSSCNALLHARLRARLSLLASLRLGSQTRSHNSTVSREPADLAYYWDTVPPTPSQLQSATAFFQKYRPRKLWTATEWRNHRPQDLLIPEVVFLGRSNVGKSSLLNALLQAPLLNHVGPRPGKTTTMHAWGLSASDPITGGAGPGGEMDSRVAVLDMPGYGYASRDDWGKEIQTYLRRRRQLRRAFVLIDALHGPKVWDKHMVELLRQGGISYQIIVSKADRLLATSKGNGHQKLQALYKLLRNELVQPQGGRGVLGLGEIIALGNLGDEKKGFKLREKDMMGIAPLRWAVLVAAGLETWATNKAIPEPALLKKPGDTGIAPPWVAGRIGTPSPVPPTTPFRSYGTHDEIVAKPPSGQAHHSNPILSASAPPYPALTHRSSTSTSSFDGLLAKQGDHRSSDRSIRNSTFPISATTSSSSSSSSSSLSYNHVGGLAELVVHSSSSNLRRKPNHPDAKPGPSRSESEKQKFKARRRLRDRSSKERSEDELDGRVRKRGEKETKRARNIMGDDGYYDDDDDDGGDDDDAPFASSPPSKHHSPPPPPPSVPVSSRPPPTPMMTGGKGVGGMADLLATSGMGRAGSKSRGGGGGGGGGGGKSRKGRKGR